MEQHVKYFIDCDYNGISRDYDSLTIAKREACKLAKRLADQYCVYITVEVIKRTSWIENGTLHSKKELITEYTY